MEHSEAAGSFDEFDEFAEWRRLDAQARGIADRLLAQRSAAAEWLGAQVERYAAIKAGLAGHAYVEESKDEDGDRTHWERAEWRRLTQQLFMQARHVADHLVDGGPAAVDTLGPLMGRYANVKRNLERLSYSVAGAHSQSLKCPNW
ncbi:MAG: hypothetical protein WAL27_19840 [Cellulosimicrobium cellulans]